MPTCRDISRRASSASPRSRSKAPRRARPPSTTSSSGPLVPGRGPLRAVVGHRRVPVEHLLGAGGDRQLVAALVRAPVGGRARPRQSHQGRRRAARARCARPRHLSGHRARACWPPAASPSRTPPARRSCPPARCAERNRPADAVGMHPGHAGAAPPRAAGRRSALQAVPSGPIGGSHAIGFAASRAAGASCAAGWVAAPSGAALRRPRGGDRVRHRGRRARRDVRGDGARDARRRRARHRRSTWRRRNASWPARSAIGSATRCCAPASSPAARPSRPSSSRTRNSGRSASTPSRTTNWTRSTSRSIASRRCSVPMGSPWSASTAAWWSAPVRPRPAGRPGPACCASPTSRRSIRTR